MSTTTPTTINAPNIETTRWRIDPARSRVAFRVPTFWGLMMVNGRFARYDGTLDLRRDPAIELTIAASSLDTKNKLRDKHLRSGDFFDAQNHPQVRFVSDSARLEGERLTVSGRLHAAGRSTPLDLVATVRRAGDELEVDTTANVDQFELGMSHGALGMIRTPAELTVHGRLVKADSPAGG